MGTLSQLRFSRKFSRLEISQFTTRQTSMEFKHSKRERAKEVVQRVKAVEPVVLRLIPRNTGWKRRTN